MTDSTLQSYFAQIELAGLEHTSSNESVTIVLHSNSSIDLHQSHWVMYLSDHGFLAKSTHP